MCDKTGKTILAGDEVSFRIGGKAAVGVVTALKNASVKNGRVGDVVVKVGAKTCVVPALSVVVDRSAR